MSPPREYDQTAWAAYATRVLASQWYSALPAAASPGCGRYGSQGCAGTPGPGNPTSYTARLPGDGDGGYRAAPTPEAVQKLHARQGETKCPLQPGPHHRHRVLPGRY